MHHEIEVKLEVRNPRTLKRRLGELGLRPISSRRFESNRLYDFADGRLRKAGWVLRLRFVDGSCCFLTLKCGALASRAYKIRREIETEIEDGQRLGEILRLLGLRETFRYERHRTVFGPKGSEDSPGSRQVAYDQTPVGNFIELEGPKRWIDAIARQLGYQRTDYITLGYPTLYSVWRQANARSRGSMPSRRA